MKTEVIKNGEISGKISKTTLQTQDKEPKYQFTKNKDQNDVDWTENKSCNYGSAVVSQCILAKH